MKYLMIALLTLLNFGIFTTDAKAYEFLEGTAARTFYSLLTGPDVQVSNNTKTLTLDISTDLTIRCSLTASSCTIEHSILSGPFVADYDDTFMMKVTDGAAVKLKQNMPIRGRIALDDYIFTLSCGTLENDTTSSCFVLQNTCSQPGC